MTIYLRDQAMVDRVREAATVRRFVVGCDLGQVNDPTALSVVETLKMPVLELGMRIREDEIKYVRTYAVRWLKRLPLGTTYPDVVTEVGALLQTAPLRGQSTLLVDQTGVGRAVVDLFRKQRIYPHGVTITSGDGYHREGGDYRVSKLALVSAVDAALHGGTLTIDGNLPETEILRNELTDFRAGRTVSGAETFAARSGKHDDLVLAVAIATWYATQIGSRQAFMGYCSWG